MPAVQPHAVQRGSKIRRSVLFGALLALIGLLLVVLLGFRFLLKAAPRNAMGGANETMADDTREKKRSTGESLRPTPIGANTIPAQGKGLPPGMDPRRTADIRRALAAISDAGPIGVGRVWAPPPTASPAASETAFMPEPDMTQANQADAGLGKYIAKRIHEDFYPLAGQCYDVALARIPDLHGRITLKMTIVGDHKIGAVIDSTQIDDSSEIMDPEFRTCLKESAMTVNFAPPPERTKEITSIFSMNFAPSPPEGK